MPQFIQIFCFVLNTKKSLLLLRRKMMLLDERHSCIPAAPAPSLRLLAMLQPALEKVMVLFLCRLPPDTYCTGWELFIFMVFNLYHAAIDGFRVLLSNKFCTKKHVARSAKAKLMTSRCCQPICLFNFFLNAERLLLLYSFATCILTSLYLWLAQC